LGVWDGGVLWVQIELKIAGGNLVQARLNLADSDKMNNKLFNVKVSAPIGAEVWLNVDSAAGTVNDNNFWQAQLWGTVIPT